MSKAFGKVAQGGALWGAPTPLDIKKGGRRTPISVLELTKNEVVGSRHWPPVHSSTHSPTCHGAGLRDVMWRHQYRNNARQHE